MHVAALIAGLFCILGVGLDAFQTIVLPRRPTGRFQITRIFFVATWAPWVAMAARASNKKVREQIFSIYGPLSLLLLLLLWALLLISGFALIYFSMWSPFGDAMMGTRSLLAQFGTDLYVSGTTLFTLGLGDVVPHNLYARGFIVFESGVGLGFVALVIGYLPVLYQAFSRREVNVALLDSRAGSPPSAAELFRRHAFEGGQEALTVLLAEWERSAAEDFDRPAQSLCCTARLTNPELLSALVSILDTCSLLICTSVIEGPPSRQAQLTFVMARHAVIDLGGVFHVQEKKAWRRGEGVNRLPSKEFYRLCEALGDNHLQLCGDPAAAKRLDTIRALYEPHALALSDYLKMPLPVWVAPPKVNDQWSVLTKLRTDAESAMKGRDDSTVSFHHD